MATNGRRYSFVAVCVAVGFVFAQVPIGGRKVSGHDEVIKMSSPDKWEGFVMSRKAVKMALQKQRRPSVGW